jgi:hypothetical protein
MREEKREGKGNCSTITGLPRESTGVNFVVPEKNVSGTPRNDIRIMVIAPTTPFSQR